MNSDTAISQQTPSLTVQASWLLIAKVVAFVFSIGAPVLIVRFLNPTEFGLYKQASLVILTAMQLLTAGFYMTLFYYLPRRPHQADKFVLNVVLVHFVVGLLGATTIAVCPSVLGRFADPSLERYAVLVAVTLLFTTVSYCLEVIATASQDVKYSAAFIVVANLSKGVIAVAVAVLSPSLRSILWGMTAQAILQCFVLIWYLGRKFRGVLHTPDWAIMREQLVYFFPFGISYYSFLILTTFHQFAVARRVSAAEYAIYAVGCTNLPLIGVLRESIAAVLVPRISYLQQAGDAHRIIELLATAARKLSLAYFPVFAFLFVLPEQFLAALYTDRFRASTPILLWNLVSLLCVVPVDPVVRAFTSQRTFAVVLKVILTALVVPGVLFGLAHFGLAGAFGAVALAMLADYIILLIKSARTLHFRSSDLHAFMPVARTAAAAMTAAAGLLLVKAILDHHRPVQMLLIGGGVFSVLYATTVFVLGIPTKSEVAFLMRLFAPVRRFLRLTTRSAAPARVRLASTAE